MIALIVVIAVGLVIGLWAWRVDRRRGQRAKDLAIEPYSQSPGVAPYLHPSEPKGNDGMPGGF